MTTPEQNSTEGTLHSTAATERLSRAPRRRWIWLLALVLILAAAGAYWYFYMQPARCAGESLGCCCGVEGAFR